MRLRASLLFLLALGCGSAFTTDESTDTTTGSFDGGPRESDGGPLPTDAGPLPDVPPVASDSPLRDALECRLGEERARRAILVHVACVDDGSTVPGLLEAWHAGLLGSFQQGVDGWTAFPMAQGCDYWQCLGAATSCEGRDACLERTRTDASCTPGERICDPINRIVECNAEGNGLVTRFDCDVVDAVCVDGGFCERPDGCRLGGFSEELGCDGADVTACEGAVRIECPAIEPGTACTSFAIGGELPTYYCGPESAGGFVAGAYATPVECFFPGGGIAFTNQATQQDERIDCVAEGFRDCNERGCIF